MEGYQWRIQIWADQAAAPTPLTLGLVMAARNSLPKARGQIFNQILTFWPLFVRKLTKTFQLEPHQGLCRWTLNQRL